MGLWNKSKAPAQSAITASAGAITRQRLVSAGARAPIAQFEAWQSEVDVYDEWGP